MATESDTEAGRIDVVSCGIGFPKDAETLGLIGRADVVYGSRALLAACPVRGPIDPDHRRESPWRMRRTPSPCAGSGGMSWYWPREMRCTTGSAVRLPAWPTPMSTTVYHPGIAAFQALFHRLGLPWQDARLFSAHSGEALPARAIAEAPLSVAYAGSRYPAHAISRAGAQTPSRVRRARRRHRRTARFARRTPLFQARWRNLARTECGPGVHPASAPDPLALRPFIPSPGLLTMRAPIPAFTKVPPYPTASPRRYSPLGSRKRTTNARTT